MRSKGSRLSFVLMGLLSMCSMHASARGFGNEVLNAGFRQPGSYDLKAAHWESPEGSMWGGSYRNSGLSYDGDNYANAIANYGGSGGYNFGGSLQYVGPLVAGKYELTAWFYCESGWTAGSAMFFLELWKGTQYLGRTEISLQGLPTNRWIQKTISVNNVAGQATYGYVVLKAENIVWNYNKRLYMDDVRVARIDNNFIIGGLIDNNGFWSGPSSPYDYWGNGCRTNWNYRDGDGWSLLVKGLWGGNNYGGGMLGWSSVVAPAIKDFEVSAWYYTDNGWSARTNRMKVEWWWKQYLDKTDVFIVTNLPDGQWARKSFITRPLRGGSRAKVIFDVSNIQGNGAMYADSVRVLDAIPAPPTNSLVVNGGFEATYNSSETYPRARGWFDDGGNLWGSAGRRTWKAYQGTASAIIGGPWTGFNYGGLWQSMSVQTNTRYTVSGRFLKEAGWNASNAVMKVEWYDEDSNPLGVRTLALTGIATNWTLKSLVTTSPPTADFALIVIEASAITGANTFYADDVRFVK